MPESGNDDKSNLKQALFTVSDAVLGAAVLLVLGVYGGAWLDRYFHTAPWLSVSLSILGGGLGLARMVVKANALDISDKTKKTNSVKKSNASSSKPSQEGKSATESSSSRQPFERFIDDGEN